MPAGCLFWLRPREIKTENRVEVTHVFRLATLKLKREIKTENRVEVTRVVFSHQIESCRSDTSLLQADS